LLVADELGPSARRLPNAWPYASLPLLSPETTTCPGFRPAPPIRGRSKTGIRLMRSRDEASQRKL